MDEKWIGLSPEQKRDRRIEKFLNPKNIKFKSRKTECLYKERATRLLKAYMCEKPDRVPVSLPIGHFPAYYAGGNLKKVM